MTDLKTREKRIEFFSLCDKYKLYNIWDTEEALDAIKFIEEYDSNILIKISAEMTDENPKFIGMSHGKIGTYTNGSCRHILCRYANTLYARQRRNYDKNIWTKLDRSLEAIIEAHQIGMPTKKEAQ